MDLWSVFGVNTTCQRKLRIAAPWSAISARCNQACRSEDCLFFSSLLCEFELSAFLQSLFSWKLLLSCRCVWIWKNYQIDRVHPAVFCVAGIFPCLEARFEFQRRVGIYLVNTYIPSILSVSLPLCTSVQVSWWDWRPDPRIILKSFDENFTIVC